MGRRTQLALAVIAGVSLLVGVLAHVIETDEEAIERITEDCRDAFLAGDVDRILAHLDPEATGSIRIGRGKLADLVRSVVERHSGRVRGIVFARSEIRVDGDDAQGRWLAWVTLKRSSGHTAGVFKLQVEIEYRRGPDGWRIRRVEYGAP
ncbi:MAG: YybH family protein [Planctomycetota bacterium]|jgi:ketosteroid isomerase-like protein